MAPKPDLPEFVASQPGVGDRLPIVFVHGWRGNRDAWDDMPGEPAPPLPEPGTTESGGEHWHPPVFPLAGCQVRVATQPPVRGLYPLMESEGHPCVTWTQTDTVGPIENSVDELERVVA